MRVGFINIGGRNWMGGAHYLANLLSALSETTECGIEPVFFGSDEDEEVLERVKPFLVEPPKLSSAWGDSNATRLSRRFQAFALQRDRIAEREFLRGNVDVVFHHCSDWFGLKFALPNMAWIADFQHRRMPEMFSKANFLKRDFGYGSIARSATSVVVSSNDARADCERYFPRSVGRVEVLHFAASLAEKAKESEADEIRAKYSLPERFFYLPNQFWRQKNHLGALKALEIARVRYPDMVIALSGHLKDTREKGFPDKIVAEVEARGLKDAFRIFGLIPREDIMPLMRASVAVINPSFFEGWSTPVEEAKSVGAPLLLSNLPVHREQAPDQSIFFNPSSPDEIAAAMSEAWVNWPAGPRPEAEARAAQQVLGWRREFAMRFAEIAGQTRDASK